MGRKLQHYRSSQAGCYAMPSHFSHVRLSVTPRWQPTRLPRPWDSPGKNTGVGCHFLLQCMKVKRKSEVAQSCLTLGDPMDCSLPGSSVHGIFQARVLEWGAIAFSISSWKGPSIPVKGTQPVGHRLDMQKAGRHSPDNSEEASWKREP